MNISRTTRFIPLSFLRIALTLAIVMGAAVGMTQQKEATAQSVSWLGADSVNYLTSSGIPVYVPSWLPGGVSGSAPEIYAGGGSYSIYFYAGSGFLYITGVAGAGFPGGSEANLNVELTVNSSVMGYPAIHDIGIPEGAENPIYDKVMWIADGVLYTVSTLGVGADSVSLANSSVALYGAPPTAVPVVEEPVWIEPTAVPVDNSNNAQTTAPTTNTQPSEQASQPTTAPVTTSQSQAGNSNMPAANTVSQTGDPAEESVTRQPTDDGTGGAWYVGFTVDSLSDGTDGPPPPILDDDGTGGAN